MMSNSNYLIGKRK